MADFFGDYLYILFAIFVLLVFAAGSILGWWAAERRAVAKVRFERPPSFRPSVKITTHPTSAPARAPAEISSISAELDELESNLAAAFPDRGIQLGRGDKLSDVVGRIKELRVRTAQSRDGGSLDIEPGPLPAQQMGPPVSFVSDLVDLYNRALENRETRNEFWRRFQVAQLGNRNATDQRMGRASESDFRTAESIGDFIAVRNPESGEFLVVPNFTISVDDTSFLYGGLREAFDCDFATGTSYQSFQVVSPAEFGNDGDHWHLRSKGELLLQL